MISPQKPQTAPNSMLVAFPQLVLLLVVVALFVPFIGKPFNIDDPLFLWTAKHIRHNPLDFYGFDVNWYRHVEPMAAVTKNPPLWSYLLAGVGICFGWSEIAMHSAMLGSLVALALGTYRLAGQLDANPLQAALITICTPVVMVSGTSVMCDVPMVALWVWGGSFWIQGNHPPYPKGAVFAAGCLVAAAGLTKYFGASLIPLLASYSLMKRVPLRRWLPYLLVPAALFLLYEAATFRLYGIGLLSDAFAYSARTRTNLNQNLTVGIINSLSFTGGGLIVAAFMTPLLFRLRVSVSWALGTAGVSMACFLLNSGNKGDMGMSMQQAAYIVTACVIVTMTLSDFLGHRDANSLLLSLWVVGTLVFAGVVNWTVSERNILPLAPAAGIIIARRLALRSSPKSGARLSLALVAALSVSLLVTVADYRWAREMVKTVQQVDSYQARTGQRLWFQGHWGFQYYMQQIGGTHIDFTASKVQAGDLFVTPSFGSNIESLSEDALEVIAELPTHPLPWLSVLNPPIGAGFYSNEFGHLPYVFARVQPEKYIMGVFRQNIHFVQ